MYFIDIKKYTIINLIVPKFIKSLNNVISLLQIWLCQYYEVAIVECDQQELQALLFITFIF